VTDVASARTLLFVPADRSDRVAKALASPADLVVVDLEDAVAAAGKAVARDVAVSVAADPRVVVRVNAAGTPWHDTDLRALARVAHTLMLPKAEDAAAVVALGRSTGAAVVALVETARGVLHAAEIAAADPVVRLAFGSMDLAAQLGVDPRDDVALAPHRATLVLASAAEGLPPPVDGVFADLSDEEGLRAETEAGRRLGYRAKLCVHPRQLDVVRRALAPTPDEVAWAREVVAVATDGVSALAGHMIDAPVVARAAALLRAVDGGPAPDAPKESHARPR